jgi:hypothetical protein
MLLTGEYASGTGGIYAIKESVKGRNKMVINL